MECLLFMVPFLYLVRELARTGCSIGMNWVGIATLKCFLKPEDKADFLIGEVST